MRVLVAIALVVWRVLPMLLLPDTLPSDKNPNAVLLNPIVFAVSASVPNATFSNPVRFDPIAAAPTAVF